MIRLALLLSIIPLIIIVKNISSQGEDAGKTTITIETKDLLNQIQCSDEFPKSLVAKTKNGTRAHIEFPELLSSPIISASLVCNKFLKAWQKHLRNKMIDRFTFELIPIQDQINQVDAIKRLRNASSSLTKICSDLGYCKNLSPFQFPSTVTENCIPRRTLPHSIEAHLPRTRKASPLPVKNMDVLLFPKVTPVNIVRRTLGDRIASTRFISTMNLGRTFFQEILRTRESYDGNNFLLFDANLFFRAELQKDIHSFSIPRGLHLIPMTSGQRFKSAYHMKIFLHKQREMAYLTAANLSTPRKSDYLEYLFRFDDRDVMNELEAILIRDISAQCTILEDVECLAEFAENDTAIIESFLTSVQHSCKIWEEQKSEKRTKAFDRYFINSQLHDIPNYLERLIQSAKKEIVIYSGHLSEKKFLRSLRDAEERGVRVYIYAAPTIEPPKELLTKNYINVAAFPRKRASLIPHMKTMLIDRETLFFGTGNFTTTGLTGSEEIFAISKEREVITNILDLATSYYHAYAPLKKNPFMKKTEDRTELVIIAPYDDYRVPSHLRNIYYRTDPEVHPAFGILTKRGRNLVRQCGLGHIKIVVENDLVQCLNVL